MGSNRGQGSVGGQEEVEVILGVDLKVSVGSTSCGSVSISSGGGGNSAGNNHSPLHRTLGVHETEIFHIRAVTPGVPQYIGSDLHFSCGYEVLSFDATSQTNTVQLQLKTELNRVGHVYLYVPTVNTNHLQITVDGKAGRWNQVGSTPREGGPSHCCGIIIRVMVVIHADGSESDGKVSVTF